jgi:hypothetical protein
MIDSPATTTAPSSGIIQRKRWVLSNLLTVKQNSAEPLSPFSLVVVVATNGSLTVSSLPFVLGVVIATARLAKILNLTVTSAGKDMGSLQ